MSAAPDAPAPERDSALPRFLARIVTPEAVYGLVLFAAIVAAISDESDADTGGAALDLNGTTYPINQSTGVLIFVVLSTLVFWAAHVFAHAVAGHGVRDGRPVPLREATRRAFHNSAGMLYAPILPAVPLLLGAFGLIPDTVTVDAALWTSVGVLAILGFLAFTAKRANWIIRILGGLGTALLGLFIIGLNAAMH